MDWRVGVLRADTENIVWTHGGAEPDWAAARSTALRHLRELAGREGRQEYRIQVGDVDGIVTPGVDSDGSTMVDGLGESLPLEHGQM